MTNSSTASFALETNMSARNGTKEHKQSLSNVNIEALDDITIPKLAFSEFTLGRMVGQGGFCTVRDITSVDLDDVYDTSALETHHRVEFAKRANNKGYGGARFVLKTLRTDLHPDENVKGVLDLAIEAEFLSVLQHANIISMHAIANSDPHESKFFVVLERLSQTLDRRFNYWRGVVGENTGYWFPVFGYCCAKANVLHQIWRERIATALEIAKALSYLHSQNIVYRDLKPDNIGFNAQGVLKIFDFGLVKRLNHAEKTFEGLYRLTGNTGSLRYMAPEVALEKPYNLSVDIYSFGIIFWQLCSLTTPYAGYSQKVHSDRAVKGGERPPVDSTWPNSWVELMTACWDGNHKVRPSADKLVQTLVERYNELVEDDGVVPTRASEIRAKSRKPKVDSNGQRLDVDTRIPMVADKGVKRYDADII